MNFDHQLPGFNLMRIKKRLKMLQLIRRN